MFLPKVTVEKTAGVGDFAVYDMVKNVNEGG